MNVSGMRAIVTGGASGLGQAVGRHLAQRGAHVTLLDVQEGPLGAPLLPGALARLACERHEVLEGGDHSILIGRVLQAEVSDGEPLAWWHGGYRRLAPG